MQLLHWVLIAISLPIIVIMVIQIRKRANALTERIEEYREEQESAKSGPVNPYEDLASLFAPDPKSPPEDPAK